MKYFFGLTLLLMATASDLPAQVVEGQHEFTIIVEDVSVCDEIPVVYSTYGYISHSISANEASNCKFRIEVRGGAGVRGLSNGGSGGGGAIIVFDYENVSLGNLHLFVGRGASSISGGGGDASAVKVDTTLLAVAGGGGGGGDARLLSGPGRAVDRAGFNGTTPPVRGTKTVANNFSDLITQYASFNILSGLIGNTVSQYNTTCNYFARAGSGGSGYTAGSAGSAYTSGGCYNRTVTAGGGGGGGSFLSTVSGITPVSTGTGTSSTVVGIENTEKGQITITKLSK